MDRGQKSRSPGRARAVAAAVCAALIAAVLLARGGDGPAKGATGLRVELDPIAGGYDLVVYLDGVDAAARRPRVRVRCVDGSGAAVIAWRERWPFGDNDGGLAAPHVHRPVTDAMEASIERCRIEETEPPLEGRVDR